MRAAARSGCAKQPSMELAARYGASTARQGRAADDCVVAGWAVASRFAAGSREGCLGKGDSKDMVPFTPGQLWVQLQEIVPGSGGCRASREPSQRAQDLTAQ